MATNISSQPGWNAGLQVAAAGTTYKATTAINYDFDNPAHMGIRVILVVSAKTGTPTNLVLTISGLDPVSGNAHTLLAGAAVTGTSTNAYTVFPAAPVTTNVSANNFLPRKFRITVTPTVADADNYFTVSIGMDLF